MEIDELELRNGLFYQKSSDKPFTGKVSGKEDGEIIEGKREGPWELYHENGQLKSKGNYKNGRKNGFLKYFNKDGSLDKTETWKNGEKQ